jgi:hypothetical protein
MDQCVIKSFKSFYVRKMMRDAYFPKGSNKIRSFLSHEEYDQFWKKMKIDTCIENVAHAWGEIPGSTLNKAWKKVLPSFFTTNSQQVEVDDCQLNEQEKILIEEFNFTKENTNAYDIISTRDCSTLNDDELRFLSLYSDAEQKINFDFEDLNNLTEYTLNHDGSLLNLKDKETMIDNQINSVIFEHDYTPAEWNEQIKCEKRQSNENLDEIEYRFRKMNKSEKLDCIHHLSKIMFENNLNN